MYFLNGGVGQLEALRKPLVVNRASFERARENLKFQPMADRIDAARRACWFRTKQELYVPYWTMPEYRERETQDPSAPVKSGLLYQPYWMTNKSRARLIQRPSLFLKPKSEVLTHLGTDEDDGLGKGFNPLKAVSRVFKPVTKAITRVIPKTALLNIATGGLYSVAKAGINIAKGKKILPELKTAIASQGIVGGIITPRIGTDKSLLLQGLVAGGALAAGGMATGGTLLTAGTKMIAKPQGPAPIPADYPPMPPETYAYPPGFAPGYAPGEAPGAMPTGEGGFGGPVQAGMFGTMSPMMIGLLIGVPLLFSLMTRSTGRR